MKMSWKYMILLTALTGCLDGAGSADGSGDTDEQGPALAQTEATLTAEEEANAVAVPATEVVRVQLFFGEHSYRVSSERDDRGTAAADSVILIETSKPDSSGRLRILRGSLSPLETYLATTAATVPVPRVLLATEPSSAVRARAAGRTIVASLSAPVQGLPASALVGSTAPLASTAQYCASGTSAAWASDVCTLTNWDVDFCHNGTWYSVTDGVGSSNKKRNSRGYTLGCGANGRVRHYYKSGGIWYKPIDEPTPSGVIIRSTKNGSWALQRQITHSRTASGFVRASSHFNVPF
ncbi:MAG: hypothetical protein R3B48_05555 [Kofleriaceae bacterium]